ncbi:hypothetical protein PR001_g25348, partial [Phytophthora rubi]
GPSGESGTDPEEASSAARESVLPEHCRLFSEAELDALEEDASPLATPELEEYDKEIEERLFPVDEIEFKKKVALNTARAREPTLEELSGLLQLPVEVLERTHEASPGKFSTPEYWLEWYRRTLAASNEAKRANRDIRKDAPSPGAVATAAPLGNGEVEREERIASIRPAKTPKASIVRKTEVANNICVSFSRATSPEEVDDEGTPGLPFRLRSLVRPVTYALVMEEEARSEVRCPQCHYPETYPPTPSSTSRFTPEERKNRARELVLELAGVLGDSVLDSVLTEITKGYGTAVRGVRFDHTSLAADRSEALGLNVSYVENEDDVLNYVCIVRDSSDPPRSSKPGLVEVPDDAGHEDPPPETDANRPVPDGKRVICSVGGFHAISGGTIADMPAELLVDTGAIASMVDSRVLKQIGLASAPLRPYEGSLNGVTGFPLEIRGEIDLPLRLGTVTRSRTFAVVGKLHVHAILGTDSLKDFRAVIDLEEGLMMLKGSGETIPLGTSRVEETYVSRVASTVRLCPGGQALQSLQ